VGVLTRGGKGGKYKKGTCTGDGLGGGVFQRRRGREEEIKRQSEEGCAKYRTWARKRDTVTTVRLKYREEKEKSWGRRGGWVLGNGKGKSPGSGDRKVDVYKN